MRPSFEKPLTADDIAMLDRIVPRKTRLFDQMDGPMVDPEDRTITLFCFEGFVGMLLGILALPTLWLVLYILVLITS